MKKTTINTVTVITFAVSLYIVVFQGFGFPNISPMLDFVLRILAALCAQVFVICNFKTGWIRVIPVAVTALFALWGGFLFVTSDFWPDVPFASYFADFCTPLFGCCAAWLICKVHLTKD